MARDAQSNLFRCCRTQIVDRAGAQTLSTFPGSARLPPADSRAPGVSDGQWQPAPRMQLPLGVEHSWIT
jgi:hypothetical protein